METLAITVDPVVIESFSYIGTVTKGLIIGLLFWVVSFGLNRAWCSIWYLAR